MRALLLHALSALLSWTMWIAPAEAQTPLDGWVLLGTTSVSVQQGTFTLQLPKDQNRLGMKAIRLASPHGAVLLERVVVSYANGQQHFDDDKIELVRGAQSAPLAEREEPLVVDTVALTGRASSGTAAIDLQVWGLRDMTLRPRAAMVGATDPKGYREIGVMFGTSRQRDPAGRVKNDRVLAAFTGREANVLTLGRAIVTIPIEREVGALPRPEFNFLFRLQFRAEDPKRDFTLAAVDVLGQREFLAQVQIQGRNAARFRNQAFVFVHGYNLSFDDAIFRTAQIAHDVGFDGPVISFSWPSRGSWSAYRHDVDTSRSAKDPLRQMLELIAVDTSIVAVNLIAHSMGNAPVTEVLGSLGEIRRSGGSVRDLKLREVVLAAPDVSRTVFEQLAAKFQGFASGGVTLYASSADKALLVSKKYAGDLVRAGDVPPHGPVIIGGVETVDVTDAGSSFFSTNHSHFAEREQLVEDMRALFTSGKHPPSARSPAFKPVGSGGKLYWRYAQ